MGEPVGHDKALKAQLILEKSVDEIRMLAARGAVDLKSCVSILFPKGELLFRLYTYSIVGSHDGPNTGADTFCKRPHIELVQNTIIW